MPCHFHFATLLAPNPFLKEVCETQIVKMKRNTFILTVLTLLLALSTLFVSCDGETQTGDLSIVLEKNVTRSILPSDYSLDITDYSLTVTNTSTSKTYTFNNKRTFFTLSDVPLGTYTITAEGKNSSGTTLVQGTTSFNFSKTNTTATVILEELVGSGGVSIAFVWAAANIETGASIAVTLTGEDNAYSETATLTAAALTTSTLTFEKSGIPSGSYTLSAILYDNGVKVSGITEAVRVVDSTTTTGSVTFSVDTIEASVGTLTLTNSAGTPVTCSISGISSGDTIAAGVTQTLTFDTGSLDESDLTIKWYYDGVYDGSGVTYSFSPEPGYHRVDVVARTNMLASSGSAQVQFEATHQGAEGEPIVSGVITTSSSIPLGGRNTIAFLDDGKVIVSSDQNLKATVCSIARNTLVAENSISYSYPVMQMLAVGNNGDKVAFLHDPSGKASTTRYDYNSSTALLSNPVNDGGYITTQISNEYMVSPLGLMKGGSKYPDTYMLFIHSDTWYNARVLRRSTTSTDTTSSSGFLYDYGIFTIPKRDPAVTYTAFATIDSGDEILAVDGDGGYVFYMKYYNGAFYTNNRKTDQTSELIGCDAVAILEVSGNYVKYVAAVGDTLKLFEGEIVDGTFTKTGEVTRSEGASGFETTKILASSDGNFLYLLNSGTNTISTYSVTTSGLSFVASTALDFSPSSGALSKDGGYLFCAPATGDFITLLRIKLPSNT